MLDEGRRGFHHPVDSAPDRGDTWDVPSALRSRVALFALLGSFLIPVFLSSLRGLTHVLTCEERVETPFTFQIVPGAEPILVSSGPLQSARTLCGGLSVDLLARSAGDNRIGIEVPIRNESRSPWHGTVLLKLGEISLPVDVGEVASGETESDTLIVDLDPGLHRVSGSLLIGP